MVSALLPPLPSRFPPRGHTGARRPGEEAARLARPLRRRICDSSRRLAALDEFAAKLRSTTGWQVGIWLFAAQTLNNNTEKRSHSPVITSIVKNLDSG